MISRDSAVSTAAAITLFALPWVAACAGDPCEEAAEALCATACDCGGGSCNLHTPDNSSISTNDEGLCVEILDLCDGSLADEDACLADTEAVSCTDSAIGRLVVVPASCATQ